MFKPQQRALSQTEKSRIRALFGICVKANEAASEDELLGNFRKLMRMELSEESKQWLVNATQAVQSIIRDPKGEDPSSHLVWIQHIKNPQTEYLITLAYNLREKLRKGGDMASEIKKLEKLDDKPLSELWGLSKN